jgi:hypothetical protein
MPAKNACYECLPRLIYTGKSRDMEPMIVAETPDLHSKD